MRRARPRVAGRRHTWQKHAIYWRGREDGWADGRLAAAEDRLHDVAMAERLYDEFLDAWRARYDAAAAHPYPVWVRIFYRLFRRLPRSGKCPYEYGYASGYEHAWRAVLDIFGIEVDR
jgi:hypothetical protein